VCAIAERRPTESVQQAADELYGLPLQDFTKARDEHARRLRKDGRREEAEAVKALRKPTVPAWALNQLARRHPNEVRELLATGTRMREGQEALLAGGDRSSLQRASSEERRLVAELTRTATEIAGEAAGQAQGKAPGKAPGKAGTSTSERIRSTLHAAALDEQTAAELGAGRLVREQEAVGLFGAAPDAAKPATSRPRRPDRTDRREGAEQRRALEQQLRAARVEEQTARREHAGAVKATARAQKRAEDAQRRVDEARTRAEEARSGLREAEQRERSAATASDRAARALRSAEKKLD
jgi:hypothetical protein